MSLHKRNKCKFVKIHIYILTFIILSFIVTSTEKSFKYLPLHTHASAATSIKAPAPNLKQGEYLGTQTLKLTNKTQGANIYYTTNGTTPTTKSKLYTTSFKISKSCVIRAITIKDNIKSNEYVGYYYIYDYKDIYSDVERFQLAIEDNKVSKLSNVDQKICKKIQTIIKDSITDKMSDYDKVKVIHDYIVNNTSYDYDNYYADTIPDESYSIEGVILNGTAVCQGYAETFQLFMNLLGIKNKFITGYANGGGHAWNLVKLNNKWYHVDTTWDDPVSAEGKPMLRYNYFLINDEQMSSDHTWLRKLYPECKDKDMMYRLYEGHIIENLKDYASKFIELYDRGLNTITILIPENTIPDMNFYYSYTGMYSYQYFYPEKFGDYYIFTVVID